MRDITEKGILDLLPEYPLYKKIDTIGKYTATMEEDVSLLVKLGLAIAAQNVLEIGTFLGETTIILAKYFSYVHTIDLEPMIKHIGKIYDLEQEYKFKESNITSIMGDSSQLNTYNNVQHLPIHLSFIDGSHSYQNAITDTFHAMRLMENGIIVFHDIVSWTEVRIALNDLSKVMDIYHVVGIGVENIAFTIL